MSESDHADFVRYVGNNSTREKVLLLYGYWIPSAAARVTAIRNGEDVAQTLLDVIEQHHNAGLSSGSSRNAATTTGTVCSSSSSTAPKVNRSYGHGSRSDIVAQEPATGAITEVLSTKLPPLIGGWNAVQQWIQTINDLLRIRLLGCWEPPNNNKNTMAALLEIRVLGRQSMPIGNFNAETDVSHRRVEYLLPVDFLMSSGKSVLQSAADQLPSFADGLRSRKFTADTNINDDDDKLEHGDDDANNEQEEDGSSHLLPYCTKPSAATLALLTSYKRIMQSLTTHIVDLDTNDAAAVFEKQAHDQKRQRNRDYRNNNKGNRKKPQQRQQHTEENSQGLGVNGSDVGDMIISKETNQEAETSVDSRQFDKSSSSKSKRAPCDSKKKEKVLRRKRYHNFTPTVMAHEFLAYRRMNRFYHRATLRFDSASFLQRIGRDPTTSTSSLETIKKRPFLVLSLSGDLFLTGQACHAVGLFIALARGLIDEDFVDCVFDEKFPHLVPTPPAPTFAMYAGDVFYISMEGKAKAILTPRKTDRYENGWKDDVTIQSVRDWQSVVRENAASEWMDKGIDKDERLISETEWISTVLNPWAEKARLQLEEYRRWKLSSTDRSSLSLPLHLNGNSTVASEAPEPERLITVLSPVESIDTSVPQIFEKVLFYLRQADASGMWPSTTLKRQLVMISNTAEEKVDNPKLVATSLSMAHRKAKLNNEERSSAYGLVEGQGGASGSFSLGAMPGDKCIQPKGNILFPELMKAAFELEVALCPHREPSSTIAVNRNAQFRPHTDSGAGAGQSSSLIVGIGSYSGGELVVEGNRMDIRYKGAEFDGWKQRHWTMPFLGERYSLVWFTPKGCEGINFVR